MERESRNLEYKESVTRSFLKTVSAYANHGGGRILFGISDEGVVVGIGDVSQACLDVENMVNDSIEPLPTYSIEPDMTTGVITLSVEEGPSKPYCYKRVAYRRSDTATLPVDRLEMQRLILAGSNLDFDEIASPEQSLTFSYLGKKASSALGIEKMSDDSLKSFGLMSHNGVYSNAAALLADVNSFPGVDVVRFGDTINDIHERRDMSGVSVLRQVDETLEMLDRFYSLDRIEHGKRGRVETIPADALREALANAVVHRQWDDRARITVAMHPDRVVVTSPGGLPETLSVDSYLNGMISRPRNPLLAYVFLRLGYIEQLGTGVARIKSCYEEKPAKPQFDVREDAISVTLPVAEMVRLTMEEQQVADVLGTALVLPRAQIEQLSGLSRGVVLRTLQSLEAKGVVQRTGNGRSTKYRKR